MAEQQVLVTLENAERKMRRLGYWLNYLGSLWVLGFGIYQATRVGAPESTYWILSAVIGTMITFFALRAVDISFGLLERAEDWLIDWFRAHTVMRRWLIAPIAALLSTFTLVRGSPVLVDTMKCITADSKLVRRPPEFGSQSTNADADDYRTTRCI